jgi:predicted transcriptional regulator of viral defense system
VGKIKHITKIRAFCKKTYVISFQSIKNIVGEEKYAKVLVHNMVKSGELFRITKGRYSLHEDPTLAVFCFKPAYLGLQDALSIHNLWEQEAITIILTTKTVREGLRTICDTNVHLRRLPHSFFFGVVYLQYGDFYVPVSDIEKTFIDLLYYKQPISTRVLAQFRKRIDKKKLKKYLGVYDKEFTKRTQLFLE